METTEPIEVDGWLRQAAFVRSLARDLVAGAHDADDLAQEAWLRALRVGPRAGWSLRAWLAGLVRNVARERRRAEERRAAHEKSAAPREASDGGDPAELAARLDLIRRALAEVARLDERERATVLHHYLDGDSLAEIARRAGEPEATVRSRLRRALERLRARLDGEAEGGRAAWLAAFAPWAEGTGGGPLAPHAPQAPTAPLAPASKFAAVAGVAAAIVVTGGAAWWAFGGATDRTSEVIRLAASEGARASEGSESHFPAPVVAERVAAGASDAESAAATEDDGSTLPPPSTEAVAAVWRVVGRVTGLDPAIAIASVTPIVVQPRATVESPLGEAELAALACMAAIDGDGRFVVTLPPLSQTTDGQGRPIWRGLGITFADPRYLDVESFVAVTDASGALHLAPHDFAVELKTQPSARAHGRVVDERGAPVADATVGWEDRGDGDGKARRVTTDEAGLFEIEASVIGSRRLIASGGSFDGDDYGSVDSRLAELLPADSVVDLVAGQDAPAGELVLRRGAAIRGRAIGRDGAPLPYARIVGEAQSTATTAEEWLEEWFDHRATTADDRGYFTLAGVVSGAWNLWIEEARGEPCHVVMHRDRELGLVAVEAPSDGVELRLATIRVELLLCLDGQPQPGLPLLIQGTSADRKSTLQQGWTTDAEGRVVFAGGPGCTFSLVLDHPYLERTTPPFTLRDDETVRRVTIDLERRRARPSLALRLLDAAGAPDPRVERACLWLEPADGSWKSPAEKRVAPEDDGLFWWREIDPGAWRVTVLPGGGSYGAGGTWQTETFEVVLDAPVPCERTIELRPTGRLTVFARDAAGVGVCTNCELLSTVDGLPRPVHFAIETLHGASGSTRGTFKDQPAFVVPPPPPGRWRLRFTSDGFSPQEVEVEVKPFETTEVVVTLARQ